jgi:uncharacterized protein YcbK (DUF882 family)
MPPASGFSREPQLKVLPMRPGRESIGAMSLTSWTRRRFTAAALTGLAAPLVATSGCASVRTRPPFSRSERWLELYNTHTDETISLAFANGEGLIPGALERLQYFLRDFRVQAEHPIDPALYDQLWDLSRAARCEPRFQVISGYRSPATNEQLRQGGHAVAEHSLHMEGRAIDVRLNGCRLAKLKDLALLAAQGGVGYYPREDFVHLDTGRVRTWQG